MGLSEVSQPPRFCYDAFVSVYQGSVKICHIVIDLFNQPPQKQQEEQPPPDKEQEEQPSSSPIDYHYIAPLDPQSDSSLLESRLLFSHRPENATLVFELPHGYLNYSLYEIDSQGDRNFLSYNDVLEKLDNCPLFRDHFNDYFSDMLSTFSRDYSLSLENPFTSLPSIPELSVPGLKNLLRRSHIELDL